MKAQRTAREKHLPWSCRVMLYRHLATQIRNQRDPISALEDLRVRLERRHRVKFAAVVTHIIRRLKNGGSLSQSLRGFVAEDEIMMISSGDYSGRLAGALDLVLDAKERTQRVNRAITGAMTTPAIQLATLYGFMFAIGAYVAPQLSSVLPESRAKGSVYVFYLMGDFFSSWLSVVPIVLFASLAGIVFWSLKRWTGPRRVIAEKYFPYSFYRDMSGYAWLLSYTSLMHAGMPDVEILRNQMQDASEWMRERLRKTLARMHNGASLPAALQGSGLHYPNEDIIDEIASVDGYPDMPEKLSGIAIRWADEIEREVVGKAKFIGMISELLMYSVMGYMMLAINSMSNQISTAIH